MEIFRYLEAVDALQFFKRSEGAEILCAMEKTREKSVASASGHSGAVVAEFHIAAKTNAGFALPLALALTIGGLSAIFFHS